MKTLFARVLVGTSLAASTGSAFAYTISGAMQAPPAPIESDVFPNLGGYLPESDPVSSVTAGEDTPTAVYDISARVVVMPDGTRLEAHSGLGNRADDPRFVRERMRGPTPPALYELIPLRALFHGVAALRLHPISGQLFGRTDLLAHTYMLHGRPESFGCVVFRDYAPFLKAFRLGHVKRLRVVPANGDAALRVAAHTAQPRTIGSAKRAV